MLALPKAAEDVQEVGLSWCNNPWSHSGEMALHISTLTAFRVFILSLIEIKIKIITGLNDLNPLRKRFREFRLTERSIFWALSGEPP